MISSNFHRTDRYKEEYKKLVDYLENNLALLAAAPANKTATATDLKTAASSSKKTNASVTTTAPRGRVDVAGMSVDAFRKAVDRADLGDRETFGRLSRLSQGLNNLAYAFNRLGEHERAAEFYLKSLKIKEALINHSRLPISLPKRADSKKKTDLNKLIKQRAKSAAPAYTVAAGPAPASAAAADAKASFAKSKGASLALTYSNLGATYSYMNDHESSIMYYKKSLELLNSLDKQKQPAGGYAAPTSPYQTAVANQYSNIAIALNRLSRHDEALRMHFNALEIREFVHANEANRPTANHELAQSLSNIGNTYYQLGDLKKANSYLERSLTMRETLRDRETEAAPETTAAKPAHSASSAIASTYYNLGVVNFYLENNEKALGYFERALELRSTAQSESVAEEHRLAKLSQEESILASQEEDRDEEDETSPAKNTLLMMDGNLDCYNHIGNLLFKMGRFKEAIRFFNMELDVFDELLRLNTRSSNHKDDYYLLTNKAGCLNNIGASYASLKEYVSAIEFMQKSLEIREQLFDGPPVAPTAAAMASSSSLASSPSSPKRGQRSHPDLANSLNNLGVVHYNLNEFEKSSDYFEKTLKIREEENRLNESQNWLGLSPRKQRINLRQLENTYRNIGLCYANMNSNKKALECFEQALNINNSIIDKHLTSGGRGSGGSEDENFERACRLDNKFYLDYIQVINERLTRSPRPVIRSVQV